jgi:hypothetical protein
MDSQELLKLLLPSYLIEYFDIVRWYEEGEILHLDFAEKSDVPSEFSNRQVLSKGFLPSISIEDFPLRGKSVRLHVRRRRWIDKDSSEILQRNWNLVAQGTKMTADFAAFLKEISRY